MMYLRKYFWLLTALGLFLSFLSIALGFFDKDLASTAGTVSTIISIILGASSFIYSFISGEKTLKYLDEIKEQNHTLVERLNQELSKGNYGQKNLDSIDRMINSGLK